MSLLNDLETFVAQSLAGVVPDDARFGFERNGLTRGAASFSVRAAGGTVTAWERTAGSLSARLSHRFVIELREAAAARSDPAQETALARGQTLVRKLGDISLIPSGSSVGQVIPGAPVIRTKTPAGGPVQVTLELPVTVLEA